MHTRNPQKAAESHVFVVVGGVGGVGVGLQELYVLFDCYPLILCLFSHQMGVNQSCVSNHTEDILYIATFNNSELLYKNYRELRQVPSSGQPIEVDGLAGGNAVKVGVIYNYLNGNFIYDLFRVKDGATLTIQVCLMI